MLLTVVILQFLGTGRILLRPVVRVMVTPVWTGVLAAFALLAAMPALTAEHVHGTDGAHVETAAGHGHDGEEAVASAHDDAVAGISHLPLVVAAALVEAVAGSLAAPRVGWSEARSLAAGGWRDTTRLARGDVTMGAGILVTNGAPVAARIRELVATLTSWADELERPGGPDPDTVARRLGAARSTLEAPEP